MRDAADRAVRRGASGSGKRARQGAAKSSSGADRNAPRRRQRAAKRAEHALELDRARLDRQLGSTKAARLLGRLGEASDAFADDRYDDARKLLRPLVDQVPTEPALRELYGLTLYRLGSWKKAVDELEEFVRLTQSTEQHPVLADCHRALDHHERVEELWEDLAAASPAAALVAEGRIVYSGSLADQGRLADAIAVLEDGALGSKTLKPHHLRMRYALADLYDRAGEQQAARRYFESIAATDPTFFDVADRLRQL